jgi:threonine dehydrogenase-like Zn-dependent dehydrogenase
MRGAVLYGPRDVRFEERDAPTIIKPTDAIITISATCVCGSDLWPYRGISPVAEPTPMGHEYCGIVEPHGVELNGEELFFTHVHLHGGPAPVRRFLPELINLVWNGKINPGKVFDLTLPLDQVAEGYRAMDERRAIKTLLRP